MKPSKHQLYIQPANPVRGAALRCADCDWSADLITALGRCSECNWTAPVYAVGTCNGERAVCFSCALELHPVRP